MHNSAPPKTDMSTLSFIKCTIVLGQKNTCLYYHLLPGKCTNSARPKKQCKSRFISESAESPLKNKVSTENNKHE